MRNLPGQMDDLMEVASFHARDSQLLCADVAAMIFPRAYFPASDELLADISANIIQLVQMLEQEITANEVANSPSPPLLDRSAHLRDPALIDFMLARQAERRLEKRLSAKSDIALSATLPARLLTNASHEIAEAAQTILAATSLNRRSAALEWRRLPPELLHALCWRIVAAVHPERSDETDQFRQNAQKMLACYDEGATTGNAVRKLLHMLGSDYADEIGNAEKAGLALFVGNLAASLRLAEDHVLQLIDRPSIAAFALLQRAAGSDFDPAMENIRLLYGFDTLTPRDITLFEDGFAALSLEDARRVVAEWQVARDSYLLPGRSDMEPLS
ncbi:MAG: hypothetical protein V3V15_07095 [Sphingorhabdus sp.]